MSEKTKVISQGNKFREIVIISEENGKKVSITQHQEKRAGNWVKRTSKKAYNEIKQNFQKRNRKKGKISLSNILSIITLIILTMFIILLFNIGNYIL